MSRYREIFSLCVSIEHVHRQSQEEVSLPHNLPFTFYCRVTLLSLVELLSWFFSATCFHRSLFSDTISQECFSHRGNLTIWRACVRTCDYKNIRSLISH